MAMPQAEATTADARVDWRREYEETLAAVQAGDCGSGDSSSGAEADGAPVVMAAPVERFLDHVLLAANAQPDADKAMATAESSIATTTSESAMLRKRLAAIGRTLRPLLSKQETVVAAAAKAKAEPQSSGAKSTRVGLLQLELVARVLGYGGVKGKSAKKKARGEIRGLLDRIALLLDAASPASIAGDDGRTPFQELLQGVLASRFEKPLPQLVRFLLKAYEFLEEEQNGVSEALPGLGALATGSAVQPSQEADGGSTTASPSADAAKHSILSALQEERSKKRPRDEIGDTFKEMLLPQELQQQRQQQRRHIRSAEKKRAASSALTSTDKRHKSSHSSQSAASISSAPVTSSAGAPSVRRAISLDVSRRPTVIRTLPTRRSLPSNSSFAPPPGVSVTAQSRLAHSLLATTPRLSSKPQPKTHPGIHIRLQRSTTTPSPASTSLTRQASGGAVVMRTPERPRRQSARATLASSSSSLRVLVAASPPLRRPRSGGQQQQQLRQQNPPPQLGGAASRPQHPRAPPPLFQ